MQGVTQNFARSVVAGVMKDTRQAFGKHVQKVWVHVTDSGMRTKPFRDAMRKARGILRRNILTEIDKFQNGFQNVLEGATKIVNYFIGVFGPKTYPVEIQQDHPPHPQRIAGKMQEDDDVVDGAGSQRKKEEND